MTFSSNESLNTNQLPISLNVDPDEKNFQSILVTYLRRVANSVNTKASALYLLQENASFEQWFGATPQQNRNGYRITFDLVALNLFINSSATIPTGTTSNLTLTGSPSPPPFTQPTIIDGYLYPVQGFGGAVDTSGLSYFLNDPQIYVRYQSSTNTLIIQNNTANALTWCVWVMEYLKT